MRAKRLLEAKGIDYQEVRLDEDQEKRRELVEKFNWRTVPMILVKDQFIGGYTELAKLENSGEFYRMLKG